MTEHQNATHKEKMQKRKEAFESRRARATHEKGLLIINTGPGKGKTTAALGMMFRALGQGFQVGVVQFIKGPMSTGEAKLAQQLDLPLTFHTMGEGFTWDTQDRERDMAMAWRAWNMAVSLLRDPAYKLVILDELNIVLRYGYLPEDEVLAELNNKRKDLHVIVTGRGAGTALRDAADLVTEMKAVKHPYKSQGVKPQAGVEY